MGQVFNDRIEEALQPANEVVGQLHRLELVTVVHAARNLMDAVDALPMIGVAKSEIEEDLIQVAKKITREIVAFSGKKSPPPAAEDPVAPILETEPAEAPPA